MLPMISAMRCSFLQDVGGELLGRQVGDVFFGARVLAVEVAAVGEQFDGGNFPRALVLFALVPPRRCSRRTLRTGSAAVLV